MRLDFRRLRGRSRRKVVLLLQCLDGDSCEVAFEPWGSVATLRRDDSFRVEIVGPADLVVEIAHRPGGLAVWAEDIAVWNKKGEPLRI
jgi:hypothetical protein